MEKRDVALRLQEFVARMQERLNELKPILAQLDGLENAQSPNDLDRKKTIYQTVHAELCFVLNRKKAVNEIITKVLSDKPFADKNKDLGQKLHLVQLYLEYLEQLDLSIQQMNLCIEKSLSSLKAQDFEAFKQYRQTELQIREKTKQSLVTQFGEKKEKSFAKLVESVLVNISAVVVIASGFFAAFGTGLKQGEEIYLPAGTQRGIEVGETSASLQAKKTIERLFENEGYMECYDYLYLLVENNESYESGLKYFLDFKRAGCNALDIFSLKERKIKNDEATLADMSMLIEELKFKRMGWNGMDLARAIAEKITAQPDYPLFLIGRGSLTEYYAEKDNYASVPAEKVNQLAVEAQKKLNMNAWYRFKPEDLQKLLKNADEAWTEDTTLLILPRTDPSGAFCTPASSELFHQIIAQGHTLAFEVETEDQLYDYIEKVGRQHGKIAFLVIAGHGVPSSTMFRDDFPELSSKPTEIYALDITDKEDIVKRDLKRYLSDSAVIWSMSCETGSDYTVQGNLAKMLHQAFERKVIASKASFVASDVSMEFDATGHIKILTIKDKKNTLIFEK